MKTAIVVEVNNGKATLLLRDGTFTQIKSEHGWEKGNIVPFRKNTSRSFLNMKYVYAAACLMVFLIAGAAAPGLYLKQTAVVSMDVNPSIEIEINRFDRVVKVNPMNEEAAAITKEVNLTNKSLETALNLLLTDTQLQKYVGKETLITFSVSADDGAEKLKQELQSITEKIYKGQEISVDSFVVEETDVEEAHHLGITAGKYHYIKQLKELGADFDEQEYCGHSISQLKNEVRECGEGHNSRGNGSIEHGSALHDGGQKQRDRKHGGHSH